MRFRLGRKKEAALANANNDEQQQNHHAAAPQTDNHNSNHTLQATLAAVYTALRPHPDALPKVESVLAELLGPQSVAAPNPGTPTTTKISS